MMISLKSLPRLNTLLSTGDFLNPNYALGKVDLFAFFFADSLRAEAAGNAKEENKKKNPLA